MVLPVPVAPDETVAVAHAGFQCQLAPVGREFNRIFRRRDEKAFVIGKHRNSLRESVGYGGASGECSQPHLFSDFWLRVN